MEDFGCVMGYDFSCIMGYGKVVSSDCFIVGLGRVGKSQGRGTCKFHLVSKAIYRQPELATLPRLRA